MELKPMAYVPSTLLLIATMVILTGCAGQRPKPNPLVECQNQVLKLKDENSDLKKQLSEAQLTIENQTNQIARLQGLTTQQFSEMTRLKEVRIDRLTSQYDGGINVYLQPIDRDGNIVKAAGSVRIKLCELQGDEPRLVGQITVKPEELKKEWIGRFWTNHYTIRVPFQKRPETQNVTVHVEFMELLTGKVFVSEKMVEVRIKPTTTIPSTQPTKS